MEPSTNVDGDDRIAGVKLHWDVASMEPSTNVDGDFACSSSARS